MQRLGERDSQLKEIADSLYFVHQNLSAVKYGTRARALSLCLSLIEPLYAIDHHRYSPHHMSSGRQFMTSRQLLMY
jgi:hypothetical protein